ncbi:MAG TPA: hypothetical protein VGD79_10650 [Thermoanaerobaculia bacterium]|jgi:hypothetical protein
MTDLPFALLASLAVIAWSLGLVVLHWASSRIVKPGLRRAVNSAVWALFCGLGMYGGHGCAPVPVIAMFFIPDHWRLAPFFLAGNWIVIGGVRSMRSAVR